MTLSLNRTGHKAFADLRLYRRMLLLLLLAAASAARGGSYSVGASLTGLGYYYSDFPRQNFTFFDYAILPAFDTSLGTLERVRYELASDFDTQASIYDDFSTQPMEVTGRYTYSIFPSVDILIGSNHLGLGVSRSGVLTEVHAPYPIDPYFFFQATPPRATAFAATTDPSLLALFGSGPYSVELGGGVSLGAELNGQPARTWQAGATAEVRISVAYDYQPVPEPASLAGWATAALVALRRRRRFPLPAQGRKTAADLSE